MVGAFLTLSGLVISNESVDCDVPQSPVYCERTAVAEKRFQTAIEALRWIEMTEALKLHASAEIKRSQLHVDDRLEADRKQNPFFDDATRLRTSDFQKSLTQEKYVAYGDTGIIWRDENHGFVCDVRTWDGTSATRLIDRADDHPFPDVASRSNKQPADFAKVFDSMPMADAFLALPPESVHGTPAYSRDNVIRRRADADSTVFLGEVTLDGTRCDVWATNVLGRRSQTWFVSQESAHVVRHWSGSRDRVYQHWRAGEGSTADGFPWLIETRFSDWRDTGSDQWMPFHQESRLTGDDGEVAEMQVWGVKTAEADQGGASMQELLPTIPDGTTVSDTRRGFHVRYREKHDRSEDEWREIFEAFTAKRDANARQEALQDELIGKAAPPLKGTWLDGQARSWNDFKGKHVVIVAYSIDCGPCVSSPKWMDRLNDKGVESICLHASGYEVDAITRAYEERLDFSPRFPTLVDTGTRAFDGAMFEALRISGMPDYIVVGPDGVIVGRGMTPVEAERCFKR